MIIRYSLTGGQEPPEYREILKIDEDGSYWMWRSVSHESNPFAPVGLFIGRLTTIDHHQLRANIEGVEAAGTIRNVPDGAAPVERIDAGEVYGSIQPQIEPGEPWRSLATQLRELLGTLTDKPAAAVDLQIVEDGGIARLSHLGNQTLKVDFRALEARIFMFEGTRVVANTRIPTGHLNAGDLIVGRGWTMDIPLDGQQAGQRPGRIACSATFTAFDGTSPTSVRLMGR